MVFFSSIHRRASHTKTINYRSEPAKQVMGLVAVVDNRHWKGEMRLRLGEGWGGVGTRGVWGEGGFGAWMGKREDNPRGSMPHSGINSQVRPPRSLFVCIKARSLKHVVNQYPCDGVF